MSEIQLQIRRFLMKEMPLMRMVEMTEEPFQIS